MLRQIDRVCLMVASKLRQGIDHLWACGTRRRRDRTRAVAQSVEWWAIKSNLRF